jgi:hypothetical protein
MFIEGLYSWIWLLYNPATNNPDSGPFFGGCGDVRTLHENLFALLYPKLKRQVSFGTGKGGTAKYSGTRRITVDFYDSEDRIAYEIDGKSHNSKISKMKDQLRDGILFIEYGIKIYRYTNKQVEQMVKNRLFELEHNGTFDKYKGGQGNG